MSERHIASAHRHGEHGIALVITLMAVLLISALAFGLSITTTGETSLAGNYRDASEARYAAEAGVERVMQELLLIPDWNTILRGQSLSSFVDGAPSGTRTAPYGGTIDLSGLTNRMNCDKDTACSASDMNAFLPERPWGANNPRWQLYAYGPAEEFIETRTVLSNYYVLVWIADDPTELDNDPLTDGGPPVSTSTSSSSTATTNGGAGVVSIRAVAFGPSGMQQMVEATVAKTDTTEIERGYTGQRGQDEQNRRARKAAVQTPGKALTRSQMTLGTGTFATQ